MPTGPQRIREVPGVERGLMSHPDEDTGHDWLNKRHAANEVDANVATLQRQRVLSQLGETSWMGPEHPSLGLASNKEGPSEAPLAQGRVQHLYRGMSEGEFQTSKARGHIASDMRGTFNIPGGEGTNAGTDPATAHSYMPRTGTGRIVKIAAHQDDAWFESRVDPYARSRQQIPWDRVVAHSEEFAHPDSDAATGLNMRERVKKDEKH
jgi:hypothetical protein